MGYERTNKREVQITMKVVGARDLPKTDRFSSIDPYITIKPYEGAHEMKTKALDNNPNPIWDEEFTFTIPLGDQTIHCHLWDKNAVSKDQQVGMAIVHVNPSVWNNNKKIWEVPIELYAKDKDHRSILLVQFTECYLTCRTLYEMALDQGITDWAFNSHAGLGRLYIPLAFGPVVIGLEFEKKAIDIKLYLTASPDDYYLDMIRVGHPCSQVRRRKVITPFTVYEGIRAYEEVKMNDVPFSEIATPGKIMVYVFKKKEIAQTDLGAVVSEHGWSGSLDFQGAAKKLTNVQIDKAEEEIWIKKEGSFIVIDFDKGNVDMKCIVLDIPANDTIAYDFTINTGDAKKTSEIYSPSKSVLGGQYKAQRKIELDDVEFGTYFSSMFWYQYALSDPAQVSVFDLLARARPNF